MFVEVKGASLVCTSCRAPVGGAWASDHLRLKLINESRVWEQRVTEFASCRAVNNNKCICEVETMFAGHFFSLFLRN